jgi:hypothetical protein
MGKVAQVKNGDDYVFGYGSLLERTSRTRTNPEAVGAWPARVTGYQRGWFHQIEGQVGYSCTFLGAVKSKNAPMNGVIYKVSDIESTIKREAGYTATELTPDQIEFLDGGQPWSKSAKPGDKVYIFVSNEKSISPSNAPTKELPIVQSYVDMCVNGCLELDAIYRTLNKGFTSEFFRTTVGWNEFWVNDRAYPRRARFTVPSATDIDKALQDAKLLHYVQLHDLG